MRKIALTLLSLPTILFASQQSLYCVSNNPGTVYLGDSLNQVISICGTPASKWTKQIYPVKKTPITQWIYNRQPNSAVTQGEMIYQPNALIINFDTDFKITKIIVNGNSVKKTNYCNTEVTLKLGDSSQTAYQLCQWADEKKETTEETLLSPKQQTTITYQAAVYTPANTLIFEDGKLTKIN